MVAGMWEQTYRIVRMFFNGHPKQVIMTGLTEAEAQAYCKDKDTSSTTCYSREAVKRTEQYGPWFDGYERED